MAVPAAKPPDLAPLLILLSATTGLVDAVSVLGLGKVFTANMTGNIVFLGFALAGVKGYTWAPYVTALAIFMLGAVLGARLCRIQTLGRRRGLMTAAAVEALLLWGAGACALIEDPPGLALSLTMIGLTAAAMGARNAIVRQLKVPDLTTTVLTLTLTGLAADSHAGGGDNTNAPRRIAAVLAILDGALVGGLLFRWSGLAAPLGLAGLITLVATFGLARDAQDA